MSNTAPSLGTILLADDSNVAQRMGREILTAEGFEVVTVSNGQAAIKSLTESAPDLILADVFMPGKSGYEVCEFVKGQWNLRHIPVVLLVGTMEPYDPQQGKKVKADGVLTKPLQSSSLLKIIHQLVTVARPADNPSRPAAKAAPEKAEAHAKAAPVPEAVPEAPPAEPMPEETAVAAAPPEVPPQEGEEPVAAFEDMLEPAAEAAQIPPAPSEAAVPEMAAAPPFPEQTAPVYPTFDETLLASPSATGNTLQEASSSAESLPGTEFLANLGRETPAELPEAPPPMPEAAAATTESQDKIVWTAEPAEVTPQDAKLFDQAASDWEGLAKLVESENTETLAATEFPPSQPETAIHSGPMETPPASGVSDQESATATAPAETDSRSTLVALQTEQATSEETSQMHPPVDPADIEHLVRQTVQDMMPQIVDRIVRQVAIVLRRQD